MPLSLEDFANEKSSQIQADYVKMSLKIQWLKSTYDQLVEHAVGEAKNQLLGSRSLETLQRRYEQGTNKHFRPART